jgi:DNA helicase-2/ATP-dependent DNA helicase PcrA
VNQSSKEKLLIAAEEYAKTITRQAAAQIPVTESDIQQITQELLNARHIDDKAVKRNFLDNMLRKLEGFRNAADSPFFARCDIDRDGKEKNLYFGKFSIPEFGIYSWVTPAAKLRFEEPGNYAYFSEAGKEVRGVLTRNDQYLISKGHITFMAMTTKDNARTLIYQEHFSNRKSSFLLPEIVERMEKAQDEVIRAKAEGSFLISGPAGSGKTTLALHRIAYLLQAPETASKFNAKDILVLVQDDSTKQYFDELLPSLGIKEVKITTFAAWAREVLGVPEFKFVNSYGRSETERDLYSFFKNKALKAGGLPKNTRSPLAWLEAFYAPFLPSELATLFQKQRKDKIIDRFDLTALLQAKVRKEGTLTEKKKVYDEKVVGLARSKWITSPLQYSLVLLDEAQNYLPEQIQLVRSCVSKKTNALTYVGDLAQQTALFTLKNWEIINERFEDGRVIKLDKVYRSTRQILEYIRSLGFEIRIPAGVREGKQVEESSTSMTDLLSDVRDIIAKNPDVVIGILGFTPESIESLHLVAANKVRVMTITEAQGVEFDVVILINQESDLSDTYPNEMREEKIKVWRDQFYVGLTRAMNQLYVFRPTRL